MRKLFHLWQTHCCAIMEEGAFSRSFQLTAIGLILLACLFVRMVIIDEPSLENTMWKEIDYIEISKNFTKNGYNIFQPKISWPAEPPRTTAMELPLVPYVASLLYPTFGVNVYTVRILTLLAFLLMTLYVFRLGKRELGPFVGLLAAFAAAIMPLYHGFRHILFSDPWVLAFSVMALFHCAQWLDFQRRKDWLLSMLFFSLAIALKLTPLYLLLPLGWLAFRKYSFDLNNYGEMAKLWACALVLPVAWYIYAYYLTKTSIDVFGIFQGHDKMQTIAMLSDPEWYRIMLGRVRWEVLGGKPGIFLCAAGIILALLLKRAGLFFFYCAAICAFFVIVAEGQIDAPYRQMTIIPPLAVFISLGAVGIISGFWTLFTICNVDKLKHFYRYKYRYSFILAMVMISTLFLYNFNKIISSFQRGVPPARILADEIKKHSKNDSRLITVGEYTVHKGGNDLSPVLYYYAGIQGWSLEKNEWNADVVSRLISKGADMFAARHISREKGLHEFVKAMKDRHKILYENPQKELLLLKLEK